MKLHFFSISLFLAGLCTGVGAQPTARFHVKTDTAYKGKVYLSVVKDRMTVIDSLDADGTDFTISYPVERTDEYRIRTRPYAFDVSVLAEPGCTYDITVTNRQATISTDDGREQLLYNGLLRQLAPITEKAAAAGETYMKLKKSGDNAGAEKMLAENNTLYKEANSLRMEFIRKHPLSFAGLTAANSYLTMDYNSMNAIKNMMAGNPHKDTYAWRSFNSKHKELADKWIQGREAPAFTTTDIDGHPVSLADYRGRYVLLDFWASWCVPCRAKMKELKKAYPQLKAKNIDVISISLDEKREAWEKASKEDMVTWTNTCELKPFRDNAIGKAYRVTSVPKLFVVSPDGIIISQDPSVDFILNNIGN